MPALPGCGKWSGVPGAQQGNGRDGATGTYAPKGDGPRSARSDGMKSLGVVDCIKCGGEVHLTDDSGEFERVVGLATSPGCVCPQPTIDTSEIFWTTIAPSAAAAETL